MPEQIWEDLVFLFDCLLSQVPTQQGRNDARDLLLLLAYAEKLQETQQHLEEVCSLMQKKVSLEGLIGAQDNRTLEAANRSLKSLLKPSLMSWKKQLLRNNYNLCMKWHNPTADTSQPGSNQAIPNEPKSTYSTTSTIHHIHESSRPPWRTYGWFGRSNHLAV